MLMMAVLMGVVYFLFDVLWNVGLGDVKYETAQAFCKNPDDTGRNFWTLRHKLVKRRLVQPE